MRGSYAGLLIMVGLTLVVSKAQGDAESRRAPATAFNIPRERGATAASPLFGVTIPEGYRQWQSVAPAHRPDFDEMRLILGNEIAMKAYRSNTLPFPDGTVLAKLAWQHVPSDKVPTAFVPGQATTLQVMVKDSKRYASTGGWGFGRFVNGKPVDAAQHQTCFSCHTAFVKDRDFVFTRYAP